MTIERVSLDEPEEDGGLFLPSRSARPSFSTGCTLLDLQLGGGWCERQIIHLRGDTGTGKSLLAIESAANYLVKFPNGYVHYLDTENAFDDNYVCSLGINMEKFIRPTVKECDRTVEAVISDVMKVLHGKDAKGSTLYIVDSWDGLSDDAELERDAHETATYGMAKAKKGSEFGRRVAAVMEQKNFTLMVVSQLRQSPVKGYGSGKRVSGGNWLRYYPTQAVDLQTKERIKNTRKGHERTYGRWIEAEAVKNRRIGPGHPVQIPIIFGYGVCDLMACVNFLAEERGGALLFEERTTGSGSTKNPDKVAKEFVNKVWTLNDERYAEELVKATLAATELWAEVTTLFEPKRRKYGQQQGERRGV